MDRTVFQQRLVDATRATREFGERFIEESLPDAVRYLALLNQSCDSLLRPGEVAYPSVQAPLELAEQEVVDVLWRDGNVPEWIDVSVVDVTAGATIVELLVCGRFTNDEQLLYHRQGGLPPFHILSPLLPWGYQDGQRFSLADHRRRSARQARARMAVATAPSRRSIVSVLRDLTETPSIEDARRPGLCAHRGRPPGAIVSRMASSRSVLVLVGPKGSGKTYVGTLINRELGVRFLRVEPIFLENMRSSHLTGMRLDEEGYSKVLAEVDSVLSREPRVIIESTGASEAFPAFLHALRSRYEVTLVSIRAPLERCLERVRSRDQTTHIPVSDDRVAEINARAAVVRLPWDLQIDNGGPALAEVILDQIRRLLSLPPRHGNDF